MLNSEWKRASRAGHALSVIVMQVSREAYDQGVYGDRGRESVLRHVADSIGAFTRRPGDVAGHTNEWEFAIVLSNTTQESTALIAQKMVQDIQSLKLKDNGAKLPAIQITTGIASMQPKPGRFPADLLKAARAGLTPGASDKPDA